MHQRQALRAAGGLHRPSCSGKPYRHHPPAEVASNGVFSFPPSPARDLPLWFYLGTVRSEKYPIRTLEIASATTWVEKFYSRAQQLSRHDA